MGTEVVAAEARKYGCYFNRTRPFLARSQRIPENCLKNDRNNLAMLYEGFTALYLVHNSLKVIPSRAIAFVTFEQVKKLLGVEFKISD